MFSVTIIHAEADAEFAAWLQELLEAHDYSAALNEEGGDVALVVLSPQLAEDGDARDLVELAYGASVPLLGVWRSPWALPTWWPEDVPIAHCDPRQGESCEELLAWVAKAARTGLQDEALDAPSLADVDWEEALSETDTDEAYLGKPPVAPEHEEAVRPRRRDVPSPPHLLRPGGSMPASSSTSAAEPPQLSAFYPARLAPQKPYALLVFAHTLSAWEQVREIAAGQSALLGEQPADRSVPSKVSLAQGALLTVVPRVEGLRFDPPEQPLIWQPPYRYVTFLFSAPQDLPETLEGQVQIYLGPLIIGEIPLQMRAVRPDQSAASGTTHEATMTRYDPIFASYSHRDTPVMQYFRRLREMLGQKMLVDIYDLRAGEKWNARLLEMIEQSAVFQLFWSEHSARSTYCRQEWQHALQYIDERPRFVQPVYWHKPLTPNPAQAAPELAALHFQYVQLPTATRARLYWRRLKNWFSR